LRLLPPKPVGYAANWRTRIVGTEPLHGARCCFCAREIAVPESARGLHVGCLYCGLDNGDLPLVEIEPCRGPENGLWLPGVNYNDQPYGRHVTIIELRG
jgi:hypothetical protein